MAYSDPQKLKAYKRRYYLQNKEVIRLKHAEYYSTHKAEYAARRKKTRPKGYSTSIRKKRLEQDPRYGWREHILRTYKLTLADFDRLVLAQGGLCAVCDIQLLKLVVDHDHDTQRVRGLVCPRCNLHFICANTAETALRVHQYLKE